MRSPLAAAILLVLAGLPGVVRGQSDPDSKTAPTPLFNVDTTLVVIPTNVTDAANRYLLGLHKEDFHLFEDGVEQSITHFSDEEAPLSVGVVFDASASMVDKLRISEEAALQFLKTMNPLDEAFLVNFSDHAELASAFTSKSDEIEAKLRAVQPGGLTALLDATEMALREMKKAKNPRKAILVISDGGDNNSKYSAHEIEALVREADVQVYAMGVFEPDIFRGLSKEEVSGPQLLKEIATQTGGRVFAASDVHDLASVATRIGVELRNQYVLAYSPKNQAKDGKYRKVGVKVSAPEGISNLKIRWRLGYYAPSSQ